MLSKNHRFHGLGSLRPVYSRGKQVRSSDLSLKYLFNRRRSTYRVAVVVSKKVHKSAVVRNRIRRRVYEIIRKNQEKITGPYDLVFSVYSEKLSEIESAELEKEILDLLKKINTTQK